MPEFIIIAKRPITDATDDAFHRWEVVGISHPNRRAAHANAEGIAAKYTPIVVELPTEIGQGVAAFMVHAPPDQGYSDSFAHAKPMASLEIRDIVRAREAK